MRMTKFIDLSVTLEARPPGTSYGHGEPEITYVAHEESAQKRAGVYGLKPSDFDFRGGKYAAVERISVGTHDATHLDAPWHYGPTSEGKPSKTIDQIPLEWCYGDGVVLDFHHKKTGEGISAKEVADALDKIGYQLKPRDIVLIRTDAYKYYGTPEYANIHPGMTRESTLWLIEHGIKLMGIDAWGWDRPHKIMVEELKAGHKERFFESHYLGMEREYIHLERLANLDKIPRPFGFKVIAFPIKIARASAGLVRAVAILED
ncbi:MAG: cyclase family protein [Chloroflexota bacterium]